MDGYDKLSYYGICIHGRMDGYDNCSKLTENISYKLIYRMAKTMKWLNAILDYMKKVKVEHINCVWPVFLTNS